MRAGFVDYVNSFSAVKPHQQEATRLDIVIRLAGGIALFLYGMNVLSNGLQKTAGSKMRNILGAVTKNKLMAIASGTVVTGIIQSSSATTVMVVGFVNAGLMGLYQASGIIMGANIGTTVTSWIVASAEWTVFLNPVKMSPVILTAGVICSFLKSQKVKNSGIILTGFGLLFMGLGNMSSSVEPLRDLPLFTELFATLGSNPILGILVGTVVTGIIQSSSASVAILQSLAITGIIPFSAAVYIIMGQNIGTCVTALISSIGTSKTAKCAAYIHLLFNIIGVAIFSIVSIVFFKFINPTFGQSIISATDISIVHTSFNIACVLIFYHKPELLIELAKKMAGVEGEVPVDSKIVHLDERILLTPSIALESIRAEIVNMGSLALETLLDAKDALVGIDDVKCQAVLEKEKIADSYASDVTKYLIKLNKSETTDEQESEITALLQTISDFERICDHCENIAESAKMLIEDNVEFSGPARDEIADIFAHTLICAENALKCFKDRDKTLTDKVLYEENLIDGLEISLRSSHVKRLASNLCNPEAGVAFLDTVTNLERISDHSRNIAEEIIKTR